MTHTDHNARVMWANKGKCKIVTPPTYYCIYLSLLPNRKTANEEILTFSLESINIGNEGVIESKNQKRIVKVHIILLM